MRFSLPLVLLIGCGSSEPAPVVTPDVEALSPALAAARVEPLVDLVEDPRGSLGAEADCPSVEVLDELVVVAGEKAGRWWIEGP